MKLIDLEPELHRYETRNGSEFLPKAKSLADAQGIMFLCPACYSKNGGPVGTHCVMVSFHGRKVEDHQGSHAKGGRPSRWFVSGNDFNDLTLQPSVDCGCWHGFVTNGEVT